MEPVLRTSHIAHGRICAVCFDSISTKNKKTQFHGVKNNAEYGEVDGYLSRNGQSDVELHPLYTKGQLEWISRSYL